MEVLSSSVLHSLPLRRNLKNYQNVEIIKIIGWLYMKLG